MSSGRHDLGSGHYFTWLVGDPATHPTDDARLLDWDDEGYTLVGIIESHPAGPAHDGARVAAFDEGMCGGAVMFVPATGEPERPIWQVVSLVPLHIEPSVHCTPDKGGCGSHGWIRDGRWVEA